MVALIHNSVLRLDGDDLNGFYRVVATPAGRDTIWIAFIASWQNSSHKDNPSDQGKADKSLVCIARDTLLDMERAGHLAVADEQPSGKYLLEAVDLNDQERAIWDARGQVAVHLLNHATVCETLIKTGGIGPLVRQATAATGCSRRTVYRVWQLLCAHGFSAASLYPRFEKCGAPGVSRPIDATRKKAGAKTQAERLGQQVSCPQVGITERDRALILAQYRLRAKPGISDRDLYELIIESAYVTRYVDSDAGRVPVLPPQGTFPNRRQVRHIIDTEAGRLERLQRRTTTGYFNRNMRGLSGKSFDGIAGPGHVYAIDSTIGDIHLRSSINRAWPVGRPIVYVIVDMWSTAVVGFYACLSGPSWATAKIALFSAFSDPHISADIWGAGKYVGALSPAPTIPFELLCDRGEYLSAGARETGKALPLSIAINPAYRPDLKGLVEVLHRIAKDDQYPFLPGAIDRRRREIELNPRAKESALTLREYIHQLYSVFQLYNLSADRRHRMTTEMMAADVQATPAGLWRFGHECGIGYQKHVPRNTLITNLLNRTTADVRRDGIFLESLQYEAPIAKTQLWTAHARNFGKSERIVYTFPGSTSQFWWPDPDGELVEFRLRPNARAPGDISIDEWRDALMFEKMKTDNRFYRRLEAAVRHLALRRSQQEEAVRLTALADAQYEGLVLNSREGRALEIAPKHQPQKLTQKPELYGSDDSDADYDATMQTVFADLNREGRV